MWQSYECPNASVVGLKDIGEIDQYLTTTKHNEVRKTTLRYFRPQTESLFCSISKKICDIVIRLDRISILFQATVNWGPIDKDYGKRMLRLLSELSNRVASVMKKYESYPKVRNIGVLIH